MRCYRFGTRRSYETLLMLFCMGRVRERRERTSMIVQENIMGIDTMD